MRRDDVLVLVNGLLLLVFFSVAIGDAVWPRAGGSTAPASLADRVNGACRPGYRLADWSTTDEMGNPSPGFVMVTCESRRLNEYAQPADVYRVAVPR